MIGDTVFRVSYHYTILYVKRAILHMDNDHAGLAGRRTEDVIV